MFYNVLPKQHRGKYSTMAGKKGKWKLYRVGQWHSRNSALITPLVDTTKWRVMPFCPLPGHFWVRCLGLFTKCLPVVARGASLLALARASWAWPRQADQIMPDFSNLLQKLRISQICFRIELSRIGEIYPFSRNPGTEGWTLREGACQCCFRKKIFNF